jgi:hypothetical protein
MDLVPWRKFGEISPFREEMDRLMNRFFGERSFTSMLSEDNASQGIGSKEKS